MIKMDNQIELTPCAVVLAPTNDNTFFHLSMVKSNKYSDIDYYRYFSILIQEMNLKIDEEFLVRTMSFVDRSYKLLKSKASEDYEER